ncbi:mannosyltransferase MgtA [Gordonia araii NBRC 100433]|uniref:Mannosyltransferase MgtA n=1 Tax=Gordonia araii NBRC 100433 TaxID=1073574 RepID=G7H7E0_9ACTN|nr:glycosyltransferase family 1 protein [Gordonia araii]NNG98448.1 glycosyltransferase family 1 protein [Gordonia araii NBRC 100433]GAB11765.1 mannosyltransferase MgtA [Gordonia araii NBRC 100433]
MRVAIVAESFLPQINGVTNSVLRVVEHLEDHGHEALIVAPDTPRGQESGPCVVGDRTPVRHVPAVMVPGVPSLPVGVPTLTVYRALRDFQPDIVHLASPFVLGGAGAYAAHRLHLPTVAVFQTDVAGFAASYRVDFASRAAWRYLRKLHSACDRTLAPSSSSAGDLRANGVPRVHRWGRGVDLGQFGPEHADADLIAGWSGASHDDDRERRLIVGFVGRLAPEKDVHKLAPLADDPTVQLVIVGDGPQREKLHEQLPGAIFTGALHGAELARAYASFDVFVHAGRHETFCQTVQEAMASGVPVIGPDAGGPRDLVGHCRTGFLLDPDHFEEKLPGAVDALRDPAIRSRFGGSALAWVRSRTWPAVCEELFGHYRDVLAERAGTSVDRRLAS